MNNYKRTLLFVAAVLVLFLAAPSVLPYGTNVATVEAKKARLSKKKLTLKAYKTKKLKIWHRKKKKKVTWHSTDKKIATVRAGKITAKKAGKCIIYAKYGKRRLECKLTVTPTSFTVSKSSLKLDKGETKTIMVKSEAKSAISVRTSNKYIATAAPLTGPGSKMPVRISGGDTAGTTTITITESKSGTKKVINVTVGGENEFKVTPANVEIKVGEKRIIWVQSDLRILPDCTWRDRDVDIVKVDWGGAWNGTSVPLEITGRSPGQEVITLTENKTDEDGNILNSRSIDLTVLVTE